MHHIIPTSLSAPISIAQQLQIKETTKLEMKTKLQLSKNVTMNKPDEKRQGMKVRTVVTGHDAKGRLVLWEAKKFKGPPILGQEGPPFSGMGMEPEPTRNAGTIRPPNGRTKR